MEGGRGDRARAQRSRHQGTARAIVLALAWLAASGRRAVATEAVHDQSEYGEWRGATRGYATKKKHTKVLGARGHSARRGRFARPEKRFGDAVIQRFLGRVRWRGRTDTPSPRTRCAAHHRRRRTPSRRASLRKFVMVDVAAHSKPVLPAEADDAPAAPFLLWPSLPEELLAAARVPPPRLRARWRAPRRRAAAGGGRRRPTSSGATAARRGRGSRGGSRRARR